MINASCKGIKIYVNIPTSAKRIKIMLIFAAESPEHGQKQYELCTKYYIVAVVWSSHLSRKSLSG